MDGLKRKRAPIRAAFTRAATSLEQELDKENPVEMTLNAIMKKLTLKNEQLVEADEIFRDKLLEDDATKAEFDEEYLAVEEYSDRLCEVQAKFENFFKKQKEGQADEFLSVASSASSPGSKRKFKLPKIELKKFSGEAKNWLGFWGQFQKIDEDNELDASDKFQYLLQSTEVGSKARELVESFPPSADCYPEAIKSLKSRFGREELLVEVYVRELLKLVLHTVMNPKVKIVMSSLYDKLEAQLRALGTLGVTTDKYAAMLYPLVESCLPEDVLRTWERNRNLVTSTNPTITNQLTLLMVFLRQEVDGEERIGMARTSFAVGKADTGKKAKTKIEETDVPTAIGLFSGNQSTQQHKEKKSPSCIFCENSHESSECRKAHNMTLEEKRKLMSKKNCCYCCLKPHHMAKDCKFKHQCLVCKKNHFAIVCPDLPSHRKNASNTESAKNEKTESTDNKVSSSLTSQTRTEEVLIQTLLVRLLVNGKEKIIRALVDGGAQRSYVSARVARDFGCELLGEESITHELFGGYSTEKKTHRKYRVYLESLHRKYRCHFAVLDETKICGKIPKIERGPWIQETKKLGIKLTDFGNICSEIDLLIGADVSGKLTTGKIHLLSSGPVALETRLGWTLSGKIPGKSSDSDSTLLVTTLHVREGAVSDLWKLDAIGITDPVENKTSQELQEAAMEHFLQTVTRDDSGRYEVSLPWIAGHPEISSNRKIAEQRLNTTTKKLKAENKMTIYSELFREWERQGIIEEVPFKELETFGHYLPHRVVMNEKSKTTPVRPCFDASARGKSSPSLNDCLEKGPNLLELLPTLVTRFRLSRIGVVADIEKAFLQIGVRAADRDFLRFLWWEEKQEIIKVFRHCRVVFGVSSSPFLLGATINYHLDGAPEHLQLTAQRLKTSLYVDNCVVSLDNKTQLTNFINESTELMSSAKFNLRGWIWNDENTKEHEVVPVLGLSWEIPGDSLCCDLRGISYDSDVPVTKRKILSIAHRIFDPIGFSCPVTLCPKLLLQETWELKVGWDQELPKDLQLRFQAWLKQLKSLEEVKVPRWPFNTDVKRENWTLHVFVDASKSAYAACVFLRGENDRGVSAQLILAKSRVAPVKMVTILRLELLACLIGARLADSVKKIINYEEIPTRYWTDSMNALCWIRNDDQWGTFVGNRVKEIRSLSSSDSWSHVPGVNNPADLPSRGCGAEQLLKSQWWEGPDWLKLLEESSPKTECTYDKEVVDSERKKTVVTQLSTTTGKKFSDVLVEDIKNFAMMVIV